jgi:hypothetical protein
MMDATTDQRVVRLPNDEELRQWQYALALRIVDLGRDGGRFSATPPRPDATADVSEVAREKSTEGRVRSAE